MSRRSLAVALAALAIASGAVAATDAGLRRSAPSHHWGRHTGHATRYARSRAGTVSFALIGENGRAHVHRPGRRFDSASVIKVMLMVAYLTAPDVRDRRLYEADRDLLQPMITWSDNATAQQVYDKVGNAGLEAVARKAHMRDFTPSAVWGLSQITAIDQARFMYRIRHYVPDRHVRYALHLLKSIVPTQRWGIPQGAPPGWTINFKGGFVPDSATGEWKINQVALIHRRPHRRMALAVLTRGNPTEGYGHETVRGVTRRLLRHYNRDMRRRAAVRSALRSRR